MAGRRTPVPEDFLQFLYLTPVGVVKFRADGAVDMINAVASALLLSMTPADDLKNMYVSLAPLAPDLRRLVAHFADPFGTILDQRWLKARARDRSLVLSLTVNQIKHDVYMAVLNDVTRLSEQERELHHDRQKFFAIFDHVPDYAIYTVTPEGVIEDWNRSVQRSGGWLAGDVQGRSMSLFFPLDDPDRPRLDLLLAKARRMGSVETEGWRLKRDGSRAWTNSVITALPDEAGIVRGFVVVSRDMTERKRQEDDMKLLATVDPLTGAYNRRQGDALLAAEFARRSRDTRPLAILMVDIDHFKDINDTFGHPAGDAVLCALVKGCRGALRAFDMVVRCGGDEFMMILPLTGPAEGMSAAERLRNALAAMRVPVGGGATVRFTVSIGVAVPTDESPVELLRRVDVALYAAKTGGRDRIALAG